MKTLSTKSVDLKRETHRVLWTLDKQSFSPAGNIRSIPSSITAGLKMQGPHNKGSRSFQKWQAALCWKPQNEEGPQFCNRKTLDSANDWNELERASALQVRPQPTTTGLSATAQPSMLEFWPTGLWADKWMAACPISSNDTCRTIEITTLKGTIQFSVSTEMDNHKAISFQNIFITPKKKFCTHEQVLTMLSVPGNH